jgi:hypothetical protein
MGNGKRITINSGAVYGTREWNAQWGLLSVDLPCGNTIFRGTEWWIDTRGILLKLTGIQRLLLT